MPVLAGDLTSGRAFESGCTCHKSSEAVLNDLTGRETVCHCEVRIFFTFITLVLRLGVAGLNSLCRFHSGKTVTLHLRIVLKVLISLTNN